MSQVRTIKRYANRKLYDTKKSGYITLASIAAMIRAGEEVRVVDNTNGDDLTQVTLSQIIFDSEKRRRGISLGLLRRLITDGGDVLGGLARGGVDRVQAKAQEFCREAQKLRGGFGGRIDQLRLALDDLQRGVSHRLRALGHPGHDGHELHQDLAEIHRRLGELEGRLEQLGDG